MMAALPARGEDTCLRFLGLLESPPSRLARALPALGSANSADTLSSGTTGIPNRIIDTLGSQWCEPCLL